MHKIVNPETGRQVSIYGDIGRDILSKYQHQLQSGGGYGAFPAKKHPKKTVKKPFTSLLPNERFSEIAESYLIRKKDWVIKEITLGKLIRKIEQDLSQKHPNTKLTPEQKNFVKQDFSNIKERALKTKADNQEYHTKWKEKERVHKESLRELKQQYRNYLTNAYEYWPNPGEMAQYGWIRWEQETPKQEKIRNFCEGEEMEGKTVTYGRTSNVKNPNHSNYPDGWAVKSEDCISHLSK